jgi:hypothetical protein
MIVTTTSHKSREMAVSLGPHGTLVTGMKQTRYYEINIRHAFCELASPMSRRNEMHLFLRASAFSRLKETLAFNLRLLYLDELQGPGAHRSGLVTGFYTAHHISGIFVTGFTNEAHYSLISDCNEL